MIDRVHGADGLVVVTPVFAASYSGLFKTFFDVLDKDALDGKPVLIAATAGTARHSLVLDHALRPLFAYLHAVVVPTGVFAATDDFGTSGGALPEAGRPRGGASWRPWSPAASAVRRRLLRARPSRSRRSSSCLREAGGDSVR